ncbi:hypothetical protein CLM62_04215 [Streptomyces sp. SA15]|nr:hypothetical protein CLM62_04215 [Streptomyces sp. SA15]
MQCEELLCAGTCDQQFRKAAPGLSLPAQCLCQILQRGVQVLAEEEFMLSGEPQQGFRHIGQHGVG